MNEEEDCLEETAYEPALSELEDAGDKDFFDEELRDELDEDTFEKIREQAVKDDDVDFTDAATYAAESGKTKGTTSATRSP